MKKKAKKKTGKKTAKKARRSKPVAFSDMIEDAARKTELEDAVRVATDTAYRKGWEASKLATVCDVVKSREDHGKDTIVVSMDTMKLITPMIRERVNELGGNPINRIGPDGNWRIASSSWGEK